MRSLAVAAAAITLSIGSSAFAQAPGMTPPQYGDGEQPTSQPRVYEAPPYQMPYQMPAPAPELPKSEATATMLSIGATTAGFAMIAGGANSENGGDAYIGLGLLTLMIGPSAGHIYAGEGSHAVGMSLLRGGAFLTFVAGFAKTLSADSECFDCGTGSTTSDKSDGERLMWLGGITFVAATVYDIMDASRAARRTNDKAHRMMMMPTMVQGANGQPVPAFGMSGRF